MIRTKLSALALIASLALAPLCQAQIAPPPGPIPTIPSLPTTPTLPATSAAAPASTTAPNNLWSWLCPTQTQTQTWTTCLCNTPLGQLMAGAAGPASMISGGLIPNTCANNSMLNNLGLPTDNPSGLAAQIQQDELDAKKRRAAVRYLGTVDCNYWPEASQTLRKSLRGDRNECVRFEAAVVLGTGCCCTHEIIEALKMSVMGLRGDGFPAETSERVRIAAAKALEHCLHCASGEAMFEPPPSELIPIDPRDLKEKLPPPIEKSQAPVNPKEYYNKVAQMPRDKVIASARAVLAQVQDPGSKKVPPLGAAPASGSLADIVGNIFRPSTHTVASAPALTPPPPGGSPVSTSLAPPPAAASAPAFAAAPPAPRQPFFSNLTRALTGRQDGVSLSPAAPAGTVVSEPTLPLTQPLPQLEVAPVNSPMPR